MTIKEVETISFIDGESGSEAVAVVRQCGDRLALAISLRDHGDLEVLVDEPTARKLASALNLGVGCINREKVKAL